MEQLADPKIIETLSLGEKMSESLFVMLLGVGIVFSVLVLLMFSIHLLSAIFYKKE